MWVSFIYSNLEWKATSYDWKRNYFKIINKPIAAPINNRAGETFPRLEGNVAAPNMARLEVMGVVRGTLEAKTGVDVPEVTKEG